ncbi:MAG: hypothetical protein Q4C54_10310 [Clostridia bacterium]|nr:hypothetical protein [Clostridia bacterium]
MKRLVSILLLLSLLMTLPAAVAEGEYSRVKSILLAQLGHPDVEQSGAAASLVLAIDMTDSTVMLLGNSGPDSEQCLWTDVESALQQSLLKSFLTDYAAYQSAPGDSPSH